jgi:hypothetical protein
MLTITKPATSGTLTRFNPQATSCLSDEEVYSLTGTLPADRIEELLDVAPLLSEAVASAPCVHEAMGQFPSEDFLQEPLDKLRDLVKRMRGDNRETLTAIIEELNTIATQQVHATEYGKEELKKVLKALED